MKTLFSLLAFLCILNVNSLDINQETLKTTEISQILSDMVKEGEIKGIFSNSQLQSFIGQVEEHYPELVEFSGVLGVTSGGNNISGLALHLQKNKSKTINRDVNRVNTQVEHVVFISYILSIDYVAIDASIGYLMSLLQGYVQENPSVVSLLKYKTIWFIPILNVDASNFLLDYFRAHKSITFIYKNRKSDTFSNEDKCGRNGYGVNINKNFPVGFSYEQDLNGDLYPCGSHYGGVSPLSESESKALDNLVSTIKPVLVINFFTADRVITYPDLTMSVKKNPFVDTFKAFITKSAMYNNLKGGLAIYDSIKHNKPSLYSRGGNLDEYLLYEKNIYSLNFFLGSSQSQYNTFLPSKDGISKLIEENLGNIHYMSCIGGNYLSLSNVHETYCQSDETCFSALNGKIEKNYYGVKLRISDLGTTPLSQNTRVCMRIPDFRHFDLQAVFSIDQKSIPYFNNSRGDTAKKDYVVSCFSVGELSRLSEAHYYLVLRKNFNKVIPEDLSQEKMKEPDLFVFVEDRPECGLMSLAITFEYKFYMYQDSSMLTNMLITAFMGISLIILCIKFFCCRKTIQPNSEESSRTDDPDDTMKNIPIQIPENPSSEFELPSLHTEEERERLSKVK